MTVTTTLTVIQAYALGSSVPYSGETINSGGDYTEGSTTTYAGATLATGGTITLVYGGTTFTATYEGLVTQDGSPVVYSTGMNTSFGGGPYFALENTLEFSGVTLSTKSVLCFVAGTRITTPEGERAVETLSAGDLVCRAYGGTAPIVWIGHRTIAAPIDDQRPVRIMAGALGGGLPERDLLLSPDHAVLLDNVLVPARHLVDGHVIRHVDVAEVRYFHVLLEQHDILLAEGTPCESLLEIAGESRFDNDAEAPDSLAFLTPCAPRIAQGEQLETIRSRLRSLACV